uniref:Down syndrome cell adhesion molecule n=1 Tax=Strigamia maritima TaxID=126957 RepID=T1IIC3_STRMM
MSNGSLVIIHVTKESEGHFLCQASNGIGSGLSKVVSIKVNVPAYFDARNVNQTVRKSNDATLKCEAGGDPPIKIMWTRNRERINFKLEPALSMREFATSTGLASELVVHKTERSDASTFSCVATNAYGHDEKLIDLTVQEQPASPKDLKIKEVTSRSVHLVWMSADDGNSPVLRHTIQYKNMAEEWDLPIVNITSLGSETSYTIEGLLPGASYQMWVIAENALGKSKTSDMIEVTCLQEVPGGPPVGVEAKAVGSSTIKITWKPPKKELWNGELHGYYVGYKVYDSTENYVYKTVKVTADFKEEIHLTNLLKFTKYSVVVQAYNKVGGGPDSDEVIAYTLEDAPSEPPQSVQCTTSTSQSIHVTWSPPPVNSQNGIIRGYKLLYTASDDDITKDYNLQQTAVIQPATTKANLHSLEKYTNYSIQVLGFTRMGDGVASAPVYCRTNEDVPGPPADVKALVMSSDAILVAWKPPARQNGIILKYTLYMRQAEKGGTQHPPTKHILSSIPNLSFEARGLKENSRYEFWVTASTVIGEGESTRVIIESPKSRVPAKIASFSDIIATLINYAQASLSQPIKDEERFSISQDGSLVISNVLYNDTGNYSCTVTNAYGTDQVLHYLVVRAPPVSPVLSVVHTSKSSITLTWKPGDDGGSRIQGYSLSYKRDFGEWEEIEVQPREEKVTLNNLHCGSRYQVYLTAYNRMGTGQPSNIQTIVTQGSAPITASRDDVLEPNVTTLTIKLEKWPDGGCRVLYFVVQYKPKTKENWILVSNNIQPDHKDFVISDLYPNTAYSVQITVHNDAGSAVAEYDFITHSKFGESLPSDMADESRDDSSPFYADLNLVVPITASLACLSIAGMAVCFFNRRRKYRGYRSSQNNSTIDPNNEVKNKMNEIRNNTTDGPVELTYTPAIGNKLDPTSFSEDVAPYATFNLPGCRANHELQAMQLQTFNENNANQTNPNTMNVSNVSYPSQRVDDLYSKVKKQRQYATPKIVLPQQPNEEMSPDQYAKSEESYSSQPYNWNKRNYGSGTDSYRRHAMPSDYDHSSVDSQDARSKIYDYYNNPTLLIQDRHQAVPDLIYHTTDSSSTSNESSPDEQRRPRRINRGRYASPRRSYANPERLNRWMPDVDIAVAETGLNYQPNMKYVNGPTSQSPERDRSSTLYRNENKAGNVKYRNYGKAGLEELESMTQQLPCYHMKANRQPCLNENCPEDNTIQV